MGVARPIHQHPQQRSGDLGHRQRPCPSVAAPRAPASVGSSTGVVLAARPTFPMRCRTEEPCGPVPTAASEAAWAAQGPAGCWGSAEEIGGIHHVLQVEFT